MQVRIICFQDSSSHCLAVLDISLFTYKIGLKSFQVGFLKLTMYFVRICRPSVELSKISLSQLVNNNIDLKKKKSKLWIPRGFSERGGMQVIVLIPLSWYRANWKMGEIQMHSATKMHIRKVLILE